MANMHDFETILDHLDSILRKCSDQDSQYADKGMLSDSHGFVCRLRSEFRLVRTAYKCITKLGKGVERCESAGLLIQDALPNCAPKIRSLCLQFSRDDQLDFYAVKADLESALSEFIKSIQFTPEIIEELYLICSTSKLPQRSLREDHVLDLINSLLENLQDLRFLKFIYRDVLRNSLDALDQNVRFLKSLIHFASLRGLHHTQMEHLFTLTQGCLLNASLLTFMSLNDHRFVDLPGEISKLLRTIKPIEPHVHEVYVHVLLASKASPSSHTPTPTPASCKAMLVDFIDSLNHKILELLNWGSDCLASFKYQILRLRKALIFLKTIMREQQNKFDDLYETRHDFIGVVICEAGIVICSLFMESNEQVSVKDLGSMFSHVFNKIKLIEALTAEINPITSEQVFVIACIFCLKKIYGDPSISKHFHVRSWCTISQEYNKNDLLYKILQHLVSSEVLEKNKDDLAHLLYQFLKGKVYLIMLDDVWDCNAWNDLKISFPNDENQSRVLLTSRNSSVPLQIRPANEPHTLRFLNIDESWELLQKKVFHHKGCPQELFDQGKRIAEKCKGLPLTIVLVLEQEDYSAGFYETS